MCCWVKLNIRVDLINCGLGQQGASRRTHAEHRRLFGLPLHLEHVYTFKASVANRDLLSVHMQCIKSILKPEQLLWLRHFEPHSREVVNFLLEKLSAPVSLIADIQYTQNICAAAGLVLRGMGVCAEQWLHVPALMQPSLSVVEDLDSLLLHVAAHPNQSSLLVHQLALRTLRAVPIAALKISGVRFSRLTVPLLHYSDECAFNLTGDHLLHSIVKLHLPAEVAHLESFNAPYALLERYMLRDANQLLRPYIDKPISDHLKSLDGAEDTLVLFIILTTLIAEAEQKAHLKVAVNRDVCACLATDCPVPFIICDMDVCGSTDLYGFVHKGCLCVGNGMGVHAVVTAWIAACGHTHMPNCTAVIEGKVLGTNTLSAFIT